ncbi:MAG: dihydrofolate reductase [Candidatus Moraniibacteriota bacterium]|nr:MAG: dihydrofolate reductase [Candidatus Moranbacteria bacterium]
MPTPRLSIIAAISENRVIGNAGKIPWHLKDDWRRFKERTLGHVIIMGRKTYESIGRPLPGRTNIVITRDTGREIPGCVVVGSLAEALERARAIETEEVFICGGGQIYTEALSQADRLYLTVVHAIIDGDAFFPEYAASFGTVVTSEDFEESGYRLTYLTLEKN